MVQPESRPPVLYGDDAARPPGELISANCGYLLSDPMQERVERLGSYAAALFGEAAPAGQGVIPDREILESLNLYERCRVEHDNPDFTFRTVRGYNEGLPATPPYALGQYKFYLSLDLTSPEKIELGSQLYRTVVLEAVYRDVAVASKYWTAHAYDALLLYTTSHDDTAVVGEVIQQVYPEFQDSGLFYATPHHFQGAVQGIDPDHIGWVQEPILPIRPRPSLQPPSFSGRLRIFGTVIDGMIATGMSAEEAITPDTIVHAAGVACIDAARPYLLNEHEYAARVPGVATPRF